VVDKVGWVTGRISPSGRLHPADQQDGVKIGWGMPHRQPSFQRRTMAMPPIS
jgi:hypothetical protein